MTYPRSDYWTSMSAEWRAHYLTLLADAERAVAERERERRKQAEAELEARELHHFETEQAIARVCHYVYTAYAVYGDELDHETILDMIPEDVK